MNNIKTLAAQDQSVEIVEVFKTDVTSPARARQLVRQICQQFSHYQVNFDLQDCDHILRIKSQEGPIPSVRIIDLLARWGHRAEVLS
jgi:hypothetical protein